MRLLALALALTGCGGKCEPMPEVPGDGIDQDCDGGDPSGAFRVLATYEGAPDLGFGHDVAFWPEGLAIGAPLGELPGVFLGNERVLTGPPHSFAGSSVRDGLVAVPRSGAGEIWDAQGQVAWTGAGTTPGGGAARRTSAGFASLHPDGVRLGEAFTATPSRPVSLLVADFGSGEQALAGLLGGGLWVEGRVLGEERELGRGLAACDFDGDGDRDLAVGRPASNLVDVFLIDDLATLDLTAPSGTVHPPEGRAGHAVACSEDGLVVGAPQAGGGAGWVGVYEAPLVLDLPRASLAGARREGLGFAVAGSGARIAASAPGEGRVYLLSAR
ncbi:MAG: hypothetical protein EP330_18480 [Deltaproteobacteria bacterium]|nr:MAG: hypothetical protein EP330_18480 [Deltaproteobacteria bacterium]